MKRGLSLQPAAINQGRKVRLQAPGKDFHHEGTKEGEDVRDGAHHLASCLRGEFLIHSFPLAGMENTVSGLRPPEAAS